MKKLLGICCLLLLSGCGYMSDAELEETIKNYCDLSYDELQNYYLDKIYDTMTDGDGNSYKTVKINNQIWMAENMADQSDNVTCYIRKDADSEVDGIEHIYYDIKTDADSDFINKYGCLYTKDDAHKVCPAGWRLPAVADFDELLRNICYDDSILRDTSWENGSNESGFAALPFYPRDSGGLHPADGFAAFWSSTPDAVSGDKGYSYIFKVTVDYTLVFGSIAPDDHYSVRCLKVSD